VNPTKQSKQFQILSKDKLLVMMGVMEFGKKEITKKSKDFSRWYTDVILKAELADYAPVKGCMVIRPYGYALWEGVQKHLGQAIKASGVPNAYFPLFIPHSFLEKEKEHVKGFSPELAVVTHGGGKKLTEPLVVRPTSETIMYPLFKKWIQSWRDLPFKVNQWCNIVRWELRTYLFLRTLEFLWQEGHTAHATHEEAEEEALARMRMYRDFVEGVLAIPTIVGKKSAAEKFAGAENTYTVEALMPDGKALQCGTSHNLGQNFAKPFAIQFQDETGQLQYVHQTSWGLSTRVIGALIMAHGDDNGLVLPPKIAPVQVVVIPIDPADKKQSEYAKNVVAGLVPASPAGRPASNEATTRVATTIDSRLQYTPGYKYNEWELKGVSLRAEIGEREVKEGTVTLVRRDTNEKFKVQSSKFKVTVEETLDAIQKNLYQKARNYLDKSTREVKEYAEFKKVMAETRGFIKAFWCGSNECETKIKEETKASIRAIPLEAKEVAEKCIYCGKSPATLVFFAQAY